MTIHQGFALVVSTAVSAILTVATMHLVFQGNTLSAIPVAAVAWFATWFMWVTLEDITYTMTDWLDEEREDYTEYGPFDKAMTITGFTIADGTTIKLDEGK